MVCLVCFLSSIINLMPSFSSVSQSKLTLQKFKTWFHGFIEENRDLLSEEQYVRLNKIEIHKKDYIIDKDCIFFKPEKEDEIFLAILGEINSGCVCRYMPLTGLHRILSSQKVGMCSIVGMNDPNEGTYADTICRSSRLHPFSRYYADREVEEIEDANNIFITSFSDVSCADSLDMWRWYGDDAKGVCLIYEINNSVNGRFVLAPVSYAKEDGSHPELEFFNRYVVSDIYGARTFMWNFNYWKHFFKAKEYKGEKEIRLKTSFYNDDSRKIIMATDGIFCPLIEIPCSFEENQYPLTLSKIILGPKLQVTESYLKQLKHILYLSGIKQSFESQSVVCSEIKNYR